MRTSIKRASLSLRINFFVMGVLLGGWSTRIPEIKNALKISDGTLGRALIGAAVGSLISSRIIGKLIRELGTKKVFFMGTIIFPVGYLSIAYAPNVY
jgi:MFS family permease